jgi:hypothetical protein
MEKLIAFNLYLRTPAGSYHTAELPARSLRLEDAQQRVPQDQVSPLHRAVRVRQVRSGEANRKGNRAWLRSKS